MKVRSKLLTMTSFAFYSDVHLYFMWLYVTWKLRLYCRLSHSCYEAYYWSDTVKTRNTLLGKPRGQLIRMIWTKENTSLLYSTIQTRAHTHMPDIWTPTAGPHAPLWPRLVSGQTPEVLSNFSTTKWMDLTPVSLVNTHSHVNNVCTMYECF